MSLSTRKLLSWLPLSLSLLACAYLLHYSDQQSSDHLAAHRQAEAYYSLLHGSGHAVVVLDANGLITEWNKPAEDLFGWKASEVFGTAPSFLMGEDLWRQHSAGLQKSAEYSMLRDLHIVDCEARHKDGHMVPVKIIARMVRNGHGPFFVALFVPVADVKMHEKPCVPDAK